MRPREIENGVPEPTPAPKSEWVLKRFRINAGVLDWSYRISARLGLETKSDKKLLRYHLAHRLLTNKIYDLDADLHSPLLEEGRDEPIIRTMLSFLDKINARDRANADVIEDAIGIHVKEFYSGNNDRANTINRAINMLVVEERQGKRGTDRFRPSRRLVARWEAEWRPQLEPSKQ